MGRGHRPTSTTTAGRTLFYVTGNVYPEIETTLPQYPHRGPRVVFRNRGRAVRGRQQRERTGADRRRTPAAAPPFGDIDNDGDSRRARHEHERAAVAAAQRLRAAATRWIEIALEGARVQPLGDRRDRHRHGRRAHARRGRVLSQSSYYSHDDCAAAFRAGRRHAGRVDRSALAGRPRRAARRMLEPNRVHRDHRALTSELSSLKLSGELITLTCELSAIARRSSTMKYYSDAIASVRVFSARCAMRLAALFNASACKAAKRRIHVPSSLHLHSVLRARRVSFLSALRSAGGLRQHRRHRHRYHPAACCPASTVTITSVERKTVDTVVTNDAGQYMQGAAAARRLRGQGRAPGLQAGGRIPTSRSTSTRRRGSTSRCRSARSPRRSTVTGDSPAPQDRSRRRRDDVRHRSRSPNCRCSIATSPSSCC